MTYSPVNVSNNILRRAFEENVDVSPMKLQKLLFFVASEYIKRTGRPLLDGAFQAWRYGPVNRTVYDEFKSFGGAPIRSYGKDAKGKAYLVNEQSDPDLQAVLDAVWVNGRQMSAVALSRLTHKPDSAWHRAYTANGSGFIEPEAMKTDQTYRTTLGVETDTLL